VDRQTDRHARGVISDILTNVISYIYSRLQVCDNTKILCKSEEIRIYGYDL